MKTRKALWEKSASHNPQHAIILCREHILQQNTAPPRGHGYGAAEGTWEGKKLMGEKKRPRSRVCSTLFLEILSLFLKISSLFLKILTLFLEFKKLFSFKAMYFRVSLSGNKTKLTQPWSGHATRALNVSYKV